MIRKLVFLANDWQFRKIAIAPDSMCIHYFAGSGWTVRSPTCPSSRLTGTVPSAHPWIPQINVSSGDDVTSLIFIVTSFLMIEVWRHNVLLVTSLFTLARCVLNVSLMTSLHMFDMCHYFIFQNGFLFSRK